MRSLLKFIIRNPWLWIVVAFLVLIGAWVTVYVLASGLKLKEIPVEKATGRSAPHHANP